MDPFPTVPKKCVRRRPYCVYTDCSVVLGQALGHLKVSSPHRASLGPSLNAKESTKQENYGDVRTTAENAKYYIPPQKKKHQGKALVWHYEPATLAFTRN